MPLDTDVIREIVRQEIASLVSDSLQPNYLTVNPDGTIGATFTGLLKALGLVIPEGATGSPEFDNSVTWERANGAQDSVGNDPATIGVTSFNLIEQLVIAANAVPPNLSADAQMGAFNAAQGTFAGIHCRAHNNDNSTLVQAQTSPGGKTVTIIDDNGNSDFVQRDSAKDDRNAPLLLGTPSKAYRANYYQPTANTWNFINMDTLEFGHNYWTDGTVGGAVNCNEAGRYLVMANLGLAVNASEGYWFASFLSKNGSPGAGTDGTYGTALSWYTQTSTAPPGELCSTVVGFFDLVPGDWVGLYGFTSLPGTACQWGSGSNYGTTMYCMKVC